MNLMIAGIFIFVLTHLIPVFTTIRSGLVNKIGELPYKGLFSVLSLVGIVLMVRGYGSMGIETLWQPPAFGRKLTTILMPVAIILVVAMHGSSNIKRWVRNPMLWGFTIWSVAHLLSNGNLRDLLLFGSILAYSVLAIISSHVQGKTSAAPAVPYYKDAIVVVAGLIITAALVYFHGSLSGVPLRG